MIFFKEVRVYGLGTAFCMLLGSCCPYFYSFTSQETEFFYNDVLGVDSIKAGTSLLYPKSSFFEFEFLLHNNSNERVDLKLSDIVGLEQKGNSFSMVRVDDFVRPNYNYADSLIVMKPNSRGWFKVGFESSIVFKVNEDWLSYVGQNPLQYQVRDFKTQRILKQGNFTEARDSQ